MIFSKLKRNLPIQSGNVVTAPNSTIRLKIDMRICDTRGLSCFYSIFYLVYRLVPNGCAQNEQNCLSKKAGIHER